MVALCRFAKGDAWQDEDKPWSNHSAEAPLNIITPDITHTNLLCGVSGKMVMVV